MSIISRTADLFYAYRFLKLLVTDWKDTDAYDNGIIDDEGKVLRKGSDLKTSDEKASYTVFHRLVFNIKRLLEKLPFGKTKLASYATALFLIREETGLSEEEILKILKKMDIDFDDTLFESTWYMNGGSELQPGRYILQSEALSPKTGEVIAEAGSKVLVEENAQPVGNMIGVPIYKVYHIKTKQEIYVNPEEISR